MLKVYELVKFEFSDYYDSDRLQELITECAKELGEYPVEDNLSMDLYYTGEMKKKIYYRLLHSSKPEDKKYIQRKIGKIYKTVENLKKTDEEKFNLKYDEETYDFCKKRYDGQESFTVFVGHYINGYYNGYDDELEKEDELLEMNALREMKKYEKKLKFKF